jgi:hypothetical protein
MKNKTQIFVFALAILIGNDLNGQVSFSSADSVIHYLTGQWEWVQTGGGITGTAHITPQSRGYTVQFEFSRIEGTSDSIAYSFYRNDTLQRTKNAGLLYEKTLIGFYSWNLTNLHGDLNTSKVIVFDLSCDTLSFADTAFDGYWHQFSKNEKNITGIPSSFVTGLKTYPNPCQTSFRVSFGGQPGLDYLRLSNLNGQTVKELANGGGEVDVSGIVPGVYILNATKGKLQIREKLIIR